MISNYKVKYSETEEVLQDVCRVNAAEKVAWNHRITVAAVGLVSIVIIMQKLEGALTKLPMYLLLWAAAFVGAEILAKTFGMKSALSSADIEGTDAYKQRMKKWGRPLEVKVEFYDDYFTTWAKGLNMKKIEYAWVSRIIESHHSIAIMAQTPGDTHKKIYGFPKSGLEDASLDEFKTFLKEKCTNMKKDIKYIEYPDKKKKAIKEKK